MHQNAHDNTHTREHTYTHIAHTQSYTRSQNAHNDTHTREHTYTHLAHTQSYIRSQIQKTLRILCDFYYSIAGRCQTQVCLLFFNFIVLLVQIVLLLNSWSDPSFCFV